jgi:hypothetical protein
MRVEPRLNRIGICSHDKMGASTTMHPHITLKKEITQINSINRVALLEGNTRACPQQQD